MKAKRTKATTATAPLPEMSGDERSLLVDAYKSGLISGWKIDREHGYRLTLANAQDEFVGAANLTAYLQALRKKLS